MRKVLIAAMALMVSAGVALAADAPKSKACSKSQSITGEVTAVDAAKGEISLKDLKGVVSVYLIPATAKVVMPGKGKKGATLADIVPGDTVTVCYEGADAAKVIKTLKVKHAKKVKAKKAAAPTPAPAAK
jgi:hypothetical protein